MGTASATSRAGLRSAGANAKQSRPTVAAKVATVTLGELRTSFKTVEKKLAKGLRVQVTRRGAVVAEMLPAPASVPASESLGNKTKWLDYLEENRIRMREIWGDQPVDIDTTALISEGRDRDFLL